MAEDSIKPIKQATEKMATGQRASEYMANERTFLAWIRTAIAIISLGFVVAKFSIWLNQLAQSAGLKISHVGASLPIGLALMIFGGILAILAYIRYNTTNQMIQSGEVKADQGMVAMVTLFVVLLSIAVVIYMLITAQVP